MARLSFSLPGFGALRHGHESGYVWIPLPLSRRLYSWTAASWQPETYQGRGYDATPSAACSTLRQLHTRRAELHRTYGSRASRDVKQLATLIRDLAAVIAAAGVDCAAEDAETMRRAAAEGELDREFKERVRKYGVNVGRGGGLTGFGIYAQGDFARDQIARNVATGARRYFEDNDYEITDPRRVFLGYSAWNYALERQPSGNVYADIHLPSNTHAYFVASDATTTEQLADQIRGALRLRAGSDHDQRVIWRVAREVATAAGMSSIAWERVQRLVRA